MVPEPVLTDSSVLNKLRKYPTYISNWVTSCELNCCIILWRSHTLILCLRSIKMRECSYPSPFWYRWGGSNCSYTAYSTSYWFASFEGSHFLCYRFHPCVTPCLLDETVWWRHWLLHRLECSERRFSLTFYNIGIGCISPWICLSNWLNWFSYKCLIWVNTKITIIFMNANIFMNIEV